MQSVITSKYQTTIPKVVREHLGLSVKDAIEWKVEKGKISIYPAKKNFLKYRNAVKTGEGEIADDIETALKLRMEKYA
jgi:AbrB family looped-hinge helix DNA binding protein